MHFNVITLLSFMLPHPRQKNIKKYNQESKTKKLCFQKKLMAKSSCCGKVPMKYTKHLFYFERAREHEASSNIMVANSCFKK